MNNGKWPLVPLGDLLTTVERREPVVPATSYRVLGTRWYAGGLFLKKVLDGSAIRAKHVYRIEQGDFVYNRLFAWKGSFAVAGAEHAGAVVSNEFPVFATDESRLNTHYLWWSFKREAAWTAAFGLSSGATPTSRNRLKERQFLQMVLPVPPLREQHRIVETLDALAAKIAESKRRWDEIQTQWRATLLAAYRRIIKEMPTESMGNVAPVVRRSLTPRVGEFYHELGIRSFGRGAFHKPAIEGSSVGSKKLYAICAGDIVFNNVFAWEGAVAVARAKDDGRVGSHRFITCVPKPGLATPEFVRFHFTTQAGLEQLGEASPGGAGRNRTLGLEALANIPIPIPPLDKQLWFGRLVAKADELHSLLLEASTDLEAILPALLDQEVSDQPDRGKCHL